MRKRIIIADDDPIMRTALHETLTAAGYETVLCEDGQAACRALRLEPVGPGQLTPPFPPARRVDLVVSDVRMPKAGGLELLKQVQKLPAPPPFIVISGHATVTEAVEAMKMGAYDFLVKPFSYRDLTSLVEAALSQDVAGEEQVAVAKDESWGDIVTTHPTMQRLLTFAAEVARSQASVLIQGESGTGKELLARFLHARSRRRQAPFVAVNCAALPEGLLESELFGYERGAFTGAVVSKPGKFELAHTGTLLLDEVSEMPLVLQAKLLRVLQEREVDRVGGRKPIPVDIRVVATTNRDLRHMITAGTFREDLFYRLNVIPLRLPPLRERISDLQPLARAMLHRQGYRQASVSTFALNVLLRHAWPGNIRELGNVLERAAIMAGGKIIEPQHIVLEEEGTKASLVDCLPGQSLGQPLDPPPDVLEAVSQPAFPLSSSCPTPEEKEPEEWLRAGVSVQEMEERLIRKTLAEVNDNRTQAAKLLGISVRTLRNKLKQYRETGMSQGTGISS